ncbi:MAG: sigma factor-like helix-turn-helix DNA-binding protein [Microbacterium sp.]
MGSSTRAGAERRAAIVEPHVLQRARTEEILRHSLGMEVVCSCSTLAELLAWLRAQPRSRWPHLLVVEPLPLQASGADLDAIAALHRARMRVLVLSALDVPPMVRRIASIAADGVVSKSDTEETVRGVIRRVLGGESVRTDAAAEAITRAALPLLSTQESLVLELYLDGLPIGEVAEAVGVRVDTARKYLSRIKQKFVAAGWRVSSKLDLARVVWGATDVRDA